MTDCCLEGYDTNRVLAICEVRHRQREKVHTAGRNALLSRDVEHVEAQPPQKVACGVR
jgi:hypothetical protein